MQSAGELWGAGRPWRVSPAVLGLADSLPVHRALGCVLGCREQNRPSPRWGDTIWLPLTLNLFPHFLGTIVGAYEHVNLHRYLCRPHFRCWVSITHFLPSPGGCATYWTLPIMAGSAAGPCGSLGL